MNHINKHFSSDELSSRSSKTRRKIPKEKTDKNEFIKAMNSNKLDEIFSSKSFKTSNKINEYENDIREYELEEEKLKRLTCEKLKINTTSKIKSNNSEKKENRNKKTLSDFSINVTRDNSSSIIDYSNVSLNENDKSSKSSSKDTKDYINTNDISAKSIRCNNNVSENEEEDSKITHEFRDRKKDYIYGLHSVEAAITFNLRKNLDLFVQMSYKQNTPQHIQRIINQAKAKNIKIKYLTALKMDKFTGNRPHNGLVLKSESRNYLIVKTFNSYRNILKKPKGNLLILLDQIVDPQNLGSIIRTAFYIGSDGILVNKNNKPPISSTVCKVSSGASECVDLYSIRCVKTFLADAIANGWIVASTAIEKESEVQMRTNSYKPDSRDYGNIGNQNKDNSEILRILPPSKNISLEEFEVNTEDNVIVVLGSEANGIVSDLSGVAHYNVYIPPRLNKELIGKHPFDIIDSLNVGVSAGIIINHVKSKLRFISN